MIPAVLILSQTNAPTLDLSLQPSGMFKLIGAYRPYGLKLKSGEPSWLGNQVVLQSPQYGTIRLGSSTYYVITDAAGKLYFDRTGSLDGRRATPVEWTSTSHSGPGGRTFTSTEALLTVDLTVGGTTAPCSIHLYKVGNSLGYYEDFGMAGTLTVDGKSYKTLYEDDTIGFDGTHGVFFVDEKGDGRIGPQSFHPVGDPFMLGGKEYEFGHANGAYALLPSTKKIVPRVEGDPNARNGLKAGSAAIRFSSTTMDGQAVSFPRSFKGKVVMLDFWATWCGPCMREAPNVVAAYRAFHDRGFEVLGISLDRKDSAQQVRDTTAKVGMVWPQVYDGNYFAADVAKKYSIQSIPEAYLVDGDTGKIVACGDAIRGEKLQPAIEKALNELHNTSSK